MGKKRKLNGGSAVTVTDPLEFLAGQSATYQDIKGTRNDNMGQAYDNTYANGYMKQNMFGFNVNDIQHDMYDKAGQLGFNPFSQKTDWERERRDTQNKGIMGINFINQFVGKTATNIGGGVIGSFYGAGAAAASGIHNAFTDDKDDIPALSKLFDNSVFRTFDKASEAIDQGNSIYTSQSAKDEGLFGVFGGIETMKGVGDAFSFIGGAVGTELITDALSGGLGLAEAPGRWAAMMKKATALGLTGEGKLARVMKAGAKGIGAGERLQEIGAKARAYDIAMGNLTASLDDVAKGLASPRAAAIQRLAMKNGMSIDALSSYANTYKNVNGAFGGVRKVMTGSMYEGALEARQTKDDILNGAGAKIDSEVKNLLSQGKLSQDGVEAYKAKRMGEFQSLADNIGLGVLATNVALLSASNYVQFPTIFGQKSYNFAKEFNGNTGLFNRAAGAFGETVQHSGNKYVEKALKFGKHLLNPATEGLEEMSQALISETGRNYFERSADAHSSNGHIEGPAAGFLDNVTASASKAFADKVKDKSFWEEGGIGALVGAIGLPTFHMNENGKMRYKEWSGGLAEGFKSSSAEEKEAIADTLRTINSGGNTLEAIKQRYVDSKEDQLREKEIDHSIESGHHGTADMLINDKIFDNVSRYVDRGIVDFLGEERQALEDMPLDEYNQKTRGDRTELFVTEEDRKAEMDDYQKKVDTYLDAYKTVYEGMRMNELNDDKDTKDLLKYLTYAVATDKTSLEAFDDIQRNMHKHGVDLTRDELYSLAKLHNKLDEKSEPNFGEKDLATLEQKAMDHINSSKENRKNHHKAGLLSEITNAEDINSYEVAMKKATDKMDPAARAKFEETEFYQQAQEHGKALAKRTEYRASQKAKADKLSKDNSFTDEGLLDKNANAVPGAVDKTYSLKKKRNSELMSELTGDERVVDADIHAYHEAREKYNKGVTQRKGVTKSFMDSLDDNSDTDKMLDKLSEIVHHRETALRVAAGLYGYDNITGSLLRIKNARIASALKNMKKYRTRVHYLNLPGNEYQDPNDVSKTVAVANLKRAMEVAKTELEDLENKGVQFNQEILNHIKEEIKRSEIIIDEYEKRNEKQDTQAQSDEAVNDPEKITRKNAGERLFDDWDEDEDEEEERQEPVKKTKKEIEAKKLQDDVELLNLDYSPEMIQNVLIARNDVKITKESFVIDPTEADNEWMNHLKDLIKSGTLNTKTRARMNASINVEHALKSAKSFSPEKAKLFHDLYEEGRKLIEGNVLLARNVDNNLKLNEEGVFDFMHAESLSPTERRNLAMQVFIASFSVGINYENGFGENAVNHNDGNQYFLFSPFSFFSEEKAKGIHQRIKQIEADIAGLNEQKSKTDNKAEIERLEDKIKVLANEHVAKTEKRNDKSIMEARKLMLMRRRAFINKGNDPADFSHDMNIKFDHPRINEHSLADMESRMQDNFSVFDASSPETNLVDDEKDLFNKLAYVDQGKGLISAKTGLPVAMDGAKQYSGTGDVYIVHKTINGTLIPVKLFTHELKSNQELVGKLTDMVYKAMTASKEAMDKSKTVEPLEDFKVELTDEEKAYFMIKADGNKHSIASIFKNFVRDTNNGGRALPGTMSIGSKSAQERNTFSIDAAEDGLLDAKEKSKDKNNVMSIFSLDEDFDENEAESKKSITEKIEKLRFFMRNHLLYNNKLDKNDEVQREPNVEAIKTMFNTGLITHGFNTANNFDKIFDSNDRNQTRLILYPEDSVGPIRSARKYENLFKKSVTHLYDGIFDVFDMKKNVVTVNKDAEGKEYKTTKEKPFYFSDMSAKIAKDITKIATQERKDLIAKNSAAAMTITDHEELANAKKKNEKEYLKGLTKALDLYFNEKQEKIKALVSSYTQNSNSYSFAYSPAQAEWFDKILETNPIGVNSENHKAFEKRFKALMERPQENKQNIPTMKLAPLNEMMRYVEIFRSNVLMNPNLVEEVSKLESLESRKKRVVDDFYSAFDTTKTGLTSSVGDEKLMDPSVSPQENDKARAVDLNVAKQVDNVANQLEMLMNYQVINDMASDFGGEGMLLNVSLQNQEKGAKKPGQKSVFEKETKVKFFSKDARAEQSRTAKVMPDANVRSPRRATKIGDKIANPGVITIRVAKKGENGELRKIDYKFDAHSGIKTFIEDLREGKISDFVVSLNTFTESGTNAIPREIPMMWSGGKEAIDTLSTIDGTYKAKTEGEVGKDRAAYRVNKLTLPKADALAGIVSNINESALNTKDVNKAFSDVKQMDNSLDKVLGAVKESADSVYDSTMAAWDAMQDEDDFMSALASNEGLDEEEIFLQAQVNKRMEAEMDKIRGKNSAKSKEAQKQAKEEEKIKADVEKKELQKGFVKHEEDLKTVLSNLTEEVSASNREDVEKIIDEKKAHHENAPGFDKIYSIVSENFLAKNTDVKEALDNIDPLDIASIQNFLDSMGMKEDFDVENADTVVDAIYSGIANSLINDVFHETEEEKENDFAEPEKKSMAERLELDDYYEEEDGLGSVNNSASQEFTTSANIGTTDNLKRLNQTIDDSFAMDDTFDEMKEEVMKRLAPLMSDDEIKILSTGSESDSKKELILKNLYLRLVNSQIGTITNANGKTDLNKRTKDAIYKIVMNKEDAKHLQKITEEVLEKCK